jgi:hypothetical protein
MNERDRDGLTVEDRVNMERPCRTLFIRNVSVRIPRLSVEGPSRFESADLPSRYHELTMPVRGGYSRAALVIRGLRRDQRLLRPDPEARHDFHYLCACWTS